MLRTAAANEPALGSGSGSAAAGEQLLAWVSDRAAGSSSLRNGSIEKMIFRRLLQGDGKGMSVPLNNTDTMHSRHWFAFGSPATATTAMRNIYWRSYHPLGAAAAARAAGSAAPAVAQRAGAAPMATPLPPNILMQTLHVLSNDWETAQPAVDVPSPYPQGLPSCPAYGASPPTQTACAAGANITQIACRNAGCCYRARPVTTLLPLPE